MHPLAGAVRTALASTRRFRETLQMHACMKSAMAYRGVAPVRKRRAVILCQFRFERDTDLARLHDSIEPNLSHADFFIRRRSDRRCASTHGPTHGR